MLPQVRIAVPTAPSFGMTAGADSFFKWAILYRFGPTERPLMMAIEDYAGTEVAELLGIKAAYVFGYKIRVAKMVRKELEVVENSKEASK